MWFLWAWECISASLFGGLDQNSSIALLALHRFPPMLPVTKQLSLGQLHVTSPCQHRPGPRHGDGTPQVTPSIPGHIWGEQLLEVPTSTTLLLSFTEAPALTRQKKASLEHNANPTSQLHACHSDSFIKITRGAGNAPATEVPANRSPQRSPAGTSGEAAFEAVLLGVLLPSLGHSGLI